MVEAIQIELNNDLGFVSVDEDRLIEAVQTLLQDHQITSGSISLAVVDGPTMHDLNRRYLDHDYPTDVLSFLLEQEESHIEGEIIVSAEMAQQRAAEFGWSVAEELLLYTIHGALHLVGFDDHTDTDREAMRQEEQRQLAHWGVEPQKKTDHE